MRQMIWVAAVGVIVLAGTGVGAGARIGESNQRGDEQGQRRGCSEATLRGAYGLQFQGTRPVRPPFPPGIESFIGVAIRTYDGEGQFTQLSNVKGAVIGIEADVESTGTYQVNEDCSGSSLVAVRGGWSGRHRPIRDRGRRARGTSRRDDAGINHERRGAAEDPRAVSSRRFRRRATISDEACPPRRSRRTPRTFNLSAEPLARAACQRLAVCHRRSVNCVPHWRGSPGRPLDAGKPTFGAIAPVMYPSLPTLRAYTATSHRWLRDSKPARRWTSPYARCVSMGVLKGVKNTRLCHDTSPRRDAVPSRPVSTS